MEIATFEAFNMRDAVKSVKKQLGADAVIVSTKQKPGPNGKGTVYEVQATAGGQVSPKTFQRQAVSASTIGPTSGSSDRSHLSYADPRNSSGRDDLLEGMATNINALRDSSATKRQVQALETGLTEIKLLLLESLRNKEGSTLAGLPPHLINIDRQLRLMNIDPVCIAELMQYLQSKTGLNETSGSSPNDPYRSAALRWMMKRIKIAPKWLVLPGSPSIQAMVGTTGTGKTSLVAKLAAQYHRREKANTLVVSYDNSRLAASDQMRVYCKVIGVPFTTISNPWELPEVLAKHPRTELVLIDTAGRNPKIESELEDLESFQSLDLPIDFHLCLSATERESQLERSIQHFSAFGLQSLAFTKLDESWSFGDIFNLSRKWGVPLSYFSIGQQIPEDIERATRERVIERIFGL